MARDEPSRRIDQPQPGHFRMRLVRRGWRVPARIVHDESGWWAEIDGEAFSPERLPEHAARVFDIWTFGEMITGGEFDYLNELREHMRVADPSHPAANARQPIDPMRLKPVGGRLQRDRGQY